MRSAFVAPAELRAEGVEEAGTDSDPLGRPRAGRAGVNGVAGLLPLGLGDATSCVSCGGYCSLVQRGAGTWWQDTFQPGLLGEQEPGRVGPGAASMGDGGLQLLQAAASELRRIGLPVLRQLLGAH